MYADSGIASDSARIKSSNRWARLLSKPCQMLFAGKPMPDLEVPGMTPQRISMFPEGSGATAD